MDNSTPILARPAAEREELAELVQRICASRHLRRSQRLRSFLEFVCSETLAGNADRICEQLIGHNVFGRAESYDPTSDNIVRVEARDLRQRLEAYFAGEGAEEPIVIRIPKGGYVPVFEQASSTLPQAPVEELSIPPVKGVSNLKQNRILIAALVALSIALGGLNLYQRLQFTAAREVRASTIPHAPLFESFWTRMFEERRPTLVSVSDSNLSLLQDIRGETASLADYSSGRYLGSLKDAAKDDEPGRILSRVATRHFTGLGDAVALARLMMLNRHQAPVVIRFPRDMNVRDLKSGNLILIGSSRSNPWVELLTEKRRFHIEHDTKLNRPYLRDKNPEPGKPAIYMTGPVGEKPYDAYGIAASVPNLDGTGNTVLVAGTNMQGTEAVGEFLSDAHRLNDFLSRIGWTAESPLPVFEVVLKVVTIGGSPTSTEIFAYASSKK